MRIGTIVQLKINCLGNEIGAQGVCYSIDYSLGRASYGVIFENGNFDGFSPEDVELFLKEIGFSSSIQYYQFTNVIKLSQDFDRGVFKSALLTE